ncbi:uncharacterized protein VTP21DRAFT_9696 [Calcarisporiella thermophila]|uniref:uncharacterized protein n=1 Tax=Calcarisporiella thermophila TaxID=911321 RepID=UPI003743EF55
MFNYFLVVDANQIRYHSGLVPRMIFFWCEAWHTRLDTPLSNIRDDTGGFYDRATEFYRSKIRKTLERAEKMDLLARRKIHDYAAAVATNMSLGEPPSQWKITGLFVPRSQAGVWVYVCPPVIRAFVQYMAESYQPSIDLLLADPALKWRAFALLITLTFRPQKRIDIRFNSRTLMGEPQDKIWNITLTQTIEQTSTLNAIPALEPGTLMILERDTRSQTYWSKVTDLKKRLIKKTKNTCTRNNMSIIEYYMSLCLTKEKTPRFPNFASLKLELDKTLPEGVHYLYITTSNTWMTERCLVRGHSVTLISRADLPLLMGSNWVVYENRL